MTITAKIVADSIADYDGRHEPIRLTTMQLRYPRFIHAEFMTHRVFSRNASSSRAIPVQKLINDVIRDTAGPIHWGANQSGMQADKENDKSLYFSAGHPDPDFHNEPTSREDAWNIARDNAIKVAELFDRAGYHKQIVNRLLEPFSHINVLVTATEWTNFYELRRHKDAQPEIHELADQMWDAQCASTPRKLVTNDYGSQWHLPYVNDADEERIADYVIGDGGAGPRECEMIQEIMIKCSVARCARVSYMTYEGKIPTIEGDLQLYERLVGSVPKHASPAEHQATPDKWAISGFGDLGWNRPWEHGNFKGWRQWRHVMV
jgi:hypothetical protein